MSSEKETYLESKLKSITFSLTPTLTRLVDEYERGHAPQLTKYTHAKVCSSHHQNQHGIWTCDAGYLPTPASDAFEVVIGLKRNSLGSAIDYDICFSSGTILVEFEDVFIKDENDVDSVNKNCNVMQKKIETALPNAFAEYFEHYDVSSGDIIKEN